MTGRAPQDNAVVTGRQKVHAAAEATLKLLEPSRQLEGLPSYDASAAPADRGSTQTRFAPSLARSVRIGRQGGCYKFLVRGRTR
jgi:hypothetical protein